MPRWDEKALAQTVKNLTTERDLLRTQIETLSKGLFDRLPQGSIFVRGTAVETALAAIDYYKALSEGSKNAAR